MNRIGRNFYRFGGAAVALALFGLGCDRASGGSEDDQGLGGADNVGESRPSAQGRVFRLRREEWLRSVRDVFNLADDLPLMTDIPKDPASQGYLFEGQAESLRVDQTLFLAYQRAAQESAELLTRFPEVVAELAPVEGYLDEAERALGFISVLLPRAFRRPATDEEIALYAAQFTVGSSSYDDRDAFAGGLRLVIETVLQSPHFLYRFELSHDKAENGLIRLTGYERASRLSYLLWGSGPDAELLEFARTGVLDSTAGVRAVAERMLGDTRADESVRYFFERVLDIDRFARISPSPSMFPDAPMNLAELAREELRRFVVDAVFRRGGGVRELLTSLDTYVNADLAKIYGVPEPTSGDFELTRLNAAERAGILTQVGFLASHATSTDPDPIHRGVFVARNIACLTVAAPPANVPPLPAPEGRTNREVVESHTEEPGTICAECHSILINPFGFPFENYDARGAYRTSDRAQPIDAASSPLLDGVNTQVENAVDLAQKLSESQEVHRCFARRLVEMGQGRQATSADQELANALGDKSLEEKWGIDQLLVEFAASQAFLFRAPEGP
jgi:hypothetical protein